MMLKSKRMFFRQIFWIKVRTNIQLNCRFLIFIGSILRGSLLAFVVLFWLVQPFNIYPRVLDYVFLIIPNRDHTNRVMTTFVLLVRTKTHFHMRKQTFVLRLNTRNPSTISGNIFCTYSYVGITYQLWTWETLLVRLSTRETVTSRVCEHQGNPNYDNKKLIRRLTKKKPSELN